MKILIIIVIIRRRYC